MKKALLVQIILGLSLITFCQVDYSIVDSLKKSINYTNLDTLKWYEVSLTYVSYPKPTYLINGREIDEKEYNFYKKNYDNILVCKPCYLKVYDEFDNLLREAVQYMDCFVGLYIDYYPNGNIKTVGQYKENLSANWDKASKVCNIKDGIWLYYDINGNLIKKEKYKNNVQQ